MKWIIKEYKTSQMSHLISDSRHVINKITTSEHKTGSDDSRETVINSRLVVLWESSVLHKEYAK